MRLKEKINLPDRADTMTTDGEEWCHCSMQSPARSATARGGRIYYFIRLSREV